MIYVRKNKLGWIFHSRGKDKEKKEGMPVSIPSSFPAFPYLRQEGEGIKTNSPNASGTWKLGTVVMVGRHAE